ncbi:MAG: glycerol-3-phosphate 1-O-acyltransferase PlsY [Gemmatimonadota bacterium]
MKVALLLAAAYLLGAVPSSHMAGRAAGVDLTRRGSGNLGGTNVFRVLGAKWAVPVVAFDVAKGFVPAWYFPLLDGVAVPEAALAYGLCAIVGHVRSVFVGFEGGKGVATSGGVVFALAPVAAFVALLVWAGTALLTRTASVASLTAAAALPVLVLLLDGPPATTGFTAALAAIVWWTHRDNLTRLREGRELRFGGREASGPGTTGSGAHDDTGGAGET